MTIPQPSFEVEEYKTENEEFLVSVKRKNKPPVPPKSVVKVIL